MELAPLITDLIGERCRAIPRPGWITDGGEPVMCVGIVRAVALDRGFILLVQDDGGHLHTIQTLTHEVQVVP